MIAFGIRRSRENKVLDLYLSPISPLSMVSDWMQEANVTPLKSSGYECLSSDQVQALINRTTESEHPQAHQRFLSAISFAESDHSYLTIDIGYFVLEALDDDVQSPEEAYFKLQLISQRHIKPHGANLNGLFASLNNVAWTNKGPILPEDVETQRLSSIMSESPLVISHVDKFPYLVNYHIPSGVRIASGSQVRLGAYLAEGTTVMPAGYVNFNAGSLGQAMIEGRVSAGVVIGDKTDIGGGASIMGTLSGGNNTVIEIGPQCLLGANAGTGISLGRGCTIAAGLYIYAGMKIALYNGSRQPVCIDGNNVADGENIVKASELSGRDYLLFIQDSRTGQVHCMPNQVLIELNTSLHDN